MTLFNWDTVELANWGPMVTNAAGGLGVGKAPKGFTPGRFDFLG